MTRARDVANIDGILTTKGDIYAATAAATPARLGVGNSGEQLEADSSTSTGLRYQAPVNVNPVLNSAFQIWQRGTTSADSAGSPYTADRWQLSRSASGGATVTRQVTGDTTNLPFIQYCARVQRNSGNTSTFAYYFSQTLETINSIPYAGKTVTVSFYARKGANYSATSDILIGQLSSGTGTDQNIVSGFTGQANVSVVNHTLTSTWQRFTMSGTVATNATELAFIAYSNPTGTAGANDWFEITGVQLEVGSVATPFKTYAGTIQGELAACQRYYEKSYSQATVPATPAVNGAYYSTQGSDAAGNSAALIRFKVEKRNDSYSTAFFVPSTATANKWVYTRSGVSETEATTIGDLFGTSGMRMYLAVGANFTVNSIFGHWVVDNEL
jgi:hypothetical protein